MQKKIEWNVEIIDEETERAKVAGGWIVTKKVGKAVACCFIPDNYHQWQIIPKIEEQDASKPVERETPAARWV